MKQFPKLSVHGFTMTPNALLDRMQEYSDAEYRIMTFLIRQTCGWGRKRCRASLTFIQHGTGLSGQGVLNALKRLLDGGAISRFSDGQSFTYEPLISDDPVDENPNHPTQLGRDRTQPPYSVGWNHPTQLGGLSLKQPKPPNVVGTKKERDLNKGKKSVFVIPEALRVPEFEAAWSGWVDECAKRRKPLTERAASMQLAKCESWGVAKAIASITASIENRWQGLFEPRQNGKQASIDPHFRQNDTNGSQASHSWKMIQQKMKRDEELALADLARQDAMEIPI